MCDSEDVLGCALGSNAHHLNVMSVLSTPVSAFEVLPDLKDWCSLYDFLTEAVCMGIFCMFGFVGNSLSMICLWKDKSKTATPFLLVSLEIADTIFLITVVILRVLDTIHTYTDQLPFLQAWPPYTV